LVQGGPPPGTCPVSSTPSTPPGTVTATPPHRPAPGTAAHARDRVGSVVEHRRPRSRAGRGHREDRGGIIVEFAAVLPFLMLALALVWQVVLIGLTSMYTSHAAAEAARQAAITPDEPSRIDEEARNRIRAPWDRI